MDGSSWDQEKKGPVGLTGRQEVALGGVSIYTEWGGE